MKIHYQMTLRFRCSFSINQFGNPRGLSSVIHLRITTQNIARNAAILVDMGGFFKVVIISTAVQFPFQIGRKEKQILFSLVVHGARHTTLINATIIERERERRAA